MGLGLGRGNGRNGVCGESDTRVRDIGECPELVAYYREWNPPYLNFFNWHKKERVHWTILKFELQ